MCVRCEYVYASVYVCVCVCVCVYVIYIVMLSCVVCVCVCVCVSVSSFVLLHTLDKVSTKVNRSVVFFNIFSTVRIHK